MANIDDFKARFPNFDATVVDSLFPFIEQEWECYFCGDYSNDCDKAAILMLQAHLFVMESNPSEASARLQQSKSVGSVSVGYAGPTHSGGQNYDFFNTTKYGQRFLMLIKKRGPGALFV